MAPPPPRSSPPNPIRKENPFCKYYSGLSILLVDLKIVSFYRELGSSGASRARGALSGVKMRKTAACGTSQRCRGSTSQSRAQVASRCVSRHAANAATDGLFQFRIADRARGLKGASATTVKSAGSLPLAKLQTFKLLDSYAPNYDESKLKISGFQ
jgi:hypothetical protein